MLPTDKHLKEILGVDDKVLARFKEVRNLTIKEAAERSLKKGKVLRAIGISGSSRDQFDTAAEDSNSEFLLKQALQELTDLGVKTELIPLRKYRIEPCKACYSTTNTQCHFYCSCYPKGTAAGDDMSNLLYDKVLGADIIIFATPVNNFKISSRMALFLDRCISLDGSLMPADLKNTKDKELNKKHTKFVELMADQNVPGSGFLRRFMGKVGGIIVTGHEEGATMAISTLYMTANHYGMVFPAWSNMYAMGNVSFSTNNDPKIVRSQVFITEARHIARNTYTLAKALMNNKKTDWQHDYASN